MKRSLLLGVLLVTLRCTDEPAKPPLAIVSISPSAGTKNTIVDITGTGFSSQASQNTVTFNGKTALVTSSTDTKLSVQVPSKAGTGVIIVSVGSQEVTGPLFEYHPFVTVSTFAGGASGYADGVGTNAKFMGPQGLTIDDAGNLYVADRSDHRIRKITSNAEVSTIAGTGVCGSENGDKSQAQFCVPTGSVMDKSGNVYVADKLFNWIRKITPSGIVSVFAGSGFNGWKDGQGTNADFNNPAGITIDPSGNLYVMDSQNSAVRKITPDGIVTTVCGQPHNYNPSFMDGVASVARFNLATGIEIDKDGNLFVADRENNRIRKITPDGTVTTFSGTGIFGNVDGPSSTAEFALPAGIGLDSNGTIYVADERNHSIRAISLDGTVSTLAGTGEPGDVDGDKSVAQFYYPLDVVVDKSGNIFVSDYFNHKIKKIVIE